jgi:hypothetical protein
MIFRSIARSARRDQACQGATSTSIGRSRFAEPETIRSTKMPDLIPSRRRQRRRRVTRSGTSPHVLKRTKRPGGRKSCAAVESKADISFVSTRPSFAIIDRPGDPTAKKRLLMLGFASLYPSYEIGFSPASIAARRMGGAQRYPSIATHHDDRFRSVTASTNPFRDRKSCLRRPW